MSLRRASSWLAAGLIAGAQFGLPALAAPDSISARVQEVFQRASKAVVKIEAADESGQLSGSGFFVDPDGTLYTCYSVGGESHDIVVTNGEVKYPATRIAADPRSGLAILKVEAQRTPFLPLGKSTDLAVASMVMTIGYPLDLPVTPNVGCVGGFGISYGDRYFAVTHIRANVPAQRGEGGAPLLNMNGEAVGVLMSSLDGGAGCFVLPIEAAEKVRSDVMRFGEVRPGWLGVKFGKTADAGVEVQGFVDDSPAAGSGLQQGDRLLKVAGRDIQSPEDVLNASFYLTAGDQVPLTVQRGSQIMAIKVQPVRNPASPPETAALPQVFQFSVRIGR